MAIISGGGRRVLHKVKPYVAMIVLQLGYAGMYVVSLATLKNGMNQYVLVVYRNVAAAAVIAPLALWFERKGRPRLTPLIFVKILALAVLEPVLEQNFYYMGGKMTSASFASTLENIIPAITYLMALVLRAEKLNIRRRRGQAKAIGTLVTVAGVIEMVLYKGPVVEFFWYSMGGAHNGDNIAASNGHRSAGRSRWLKGTLMIIGSSSWWSAFLILQANTLKSYPAELTLTVLICSMGAVMGAAVELVVERGSAAPWVIGWDNRLLAPVYSGVVCSGFSYFMQGIVMKERGPVFVSAFSPLCMIMTALMGSFILSEKITLGMLIGAVIIASGLYSLLWGNCQDQEISSQSEAHDSVKISTDQGSRVDDIFTAQL
ncbi:WAT1-related protein [Apostasia shenzhenica]|uniref:WAT1-related protein n=1 Tax=Apostasia shenzhenica TaxID=1088818 RepID=A0A2I0A360_9ASPA|nr:WAT1-related protein [Apostasia shenzhenica]